MWIVTIGILIALLLTYLESSGQLKNGMLYGFIIVATLQMIHYDFGNDYMGYLQNYNEYTRYVFNYQSIKDGVFYKDWGWVILCFLFKPLGGFFTMVAVLSIIQNIIIYRFIQREIRSDLLLFAVFIYLVNTAFYVLGFSMLRQWFVCCVFLGMWKYIKKKNWIIPLVVLSSCSLIHASARILIPFAFFGFLPVNKGKVLVWVLLLFIAFLWLAKEPVLNMLEGVIKVGSFEDYFSTYSDDESTATFRLGFVLNCIPIVLSLLYLWNNEGDECSRRMVIMSVIPFLLIPFAQIVPLIGRIGNYFAIYQIASYPIIYKAVNKKIIRQACTAIYVLITIYGYFGFYASPVWREHFSTFHTIFSVL